MKMKYAILGGLLAIVALTSACVKTPPKQGPILAISASETVLGTIQDTENSLFKSGQETAAIHHKVNAALEKAFKAQIEAATALKTYKAGDPIPQSLLGYAKAVQDLITALQTIDVSPVQQSLLASAQQVLGSLTTLLSVIEVK